MPVDIAGKKQVSLHDWQCALLSWPLVFVDGKGNRVINELNFLAPVGVGIRFEAAGLMASELSAPFRNYPDLRYGHSPDIIAAAPGLDLARKLHEKVHDILKKNPEFERRYKIKSTQKCIESKRTGASIKQRTTSSSEIASAPITFACVYSIEIISDETPISRIRTELQLDKNHLLVTAGTPGRKCTSALNPIREATKRWLRNKKELGNRVGLLYQAEDTDSYEDFQVWKRVYPGYTEARVSDM